MYQTEHAFKLFSADVKSGELGNVLLLYGSEPFLFKWAFDTLVSKYVSPGMESMDSIIIYEEELEDRGLVDAVIEACETMPMISEKKIVWVREPAFLNAEGERTLPKDDMARLLSYMDSPAEDSILVFSGENFDPKARKNADFFSRVSEYNMDKLDGSNLRRFITKRFRTAGVTVMDRDVSLLIEECGYFNRDSDYDLYRMEQDIEKLLAVSRGGRLPNGAIEALVRGDEETYIFDLIDSICSGKKDRALTMLHNNISAGEDVFGILGILTSQFESIFSVQGMMDRGYSRTDMTKKLKTGEYRIKKLIPYATKFRPVDVENILSGLYEVDREIKSGLMAPKLAMELFIANL